MARLCGPHLTCLGLAAPLLSSVKAFDYFWALGGLFPYEKPTDLLPTSIMSELIALQWGVSHGGMAKTYSMEGQCPPQVSCWHGILSLFDSQRVLKLKLPLNEMVLRQFVFSGSLGTTLFCPVLGCWCPVWGPETKTNVACSAHPVAQLNRGASRSAANVLCR